ncbi:MAG: DUF2059 domain-containing protein [Spirochaetia bacterium]|jgi:hypothetical protein|nr:DUF2059 domain-containing protein [Spirochaetia bacterium]
MKKYILALVLALAAVFGFSQEKAGVKEKDIFRLLETLNTRALAVQIFDMVIPQIAQLAPNVPQNVWDMFREKIDADDFAKLCIAIYDRHFSHEEILALIEFYESPLGRRLVEETPGITQDSMAAGQEWGMRLGQQIMLELEKSGYLDT